jgi:hypothetical protein
MPSMRVLAAAAALLLCGGCGAAEEPAAVPEAARAPAQCAETTASPTAERPPALASSTSGWFGEDELWVGLPDYPPATQGDALVLRFPVVTLDDGEPTGERGAPVVTAERVDAAGEAPGQVGGFSHAYGTDGLAFWPASVVFPDPGCWAVTSLLGTASLQFTVAVAAP